MIRKIIATKRFGLKMAKYWFPNLASHIKREGMKKITLIEKAYKVSKEPKSRTWANAMNSKSGVGETSAYMIQKILLKLGFSKDITKFIKID